MNSYLQWIENLRTILVRIWGVPWVKLVFPILGFMTLFNWAFVHNVSSRAKFFVDLTFFANLNFYIAGLFTSSVFFGFFSAGAYHAISMFFQNGLTNGLDKLNSAEKPSFVIGGCVSGVMFSIFLLGPYALQTWVFLLGGYGLAKIGEWWSASQADGGAEEAEGSLVNAIVRAYPALVLSLLGYYSASLSAQSIKQSIPYQITLGDEVEFVRLIGRNSLGYV